ncbi:uncharacterized protein AB675_2304 [Cyphellophora attinorum]|uniref:Uncharacterized protein n=1 Tax=Cyphellophora attinorum TaxID=1664694 RepID=A0A0N1HAC6_9EURO|nr:uncharacterized protein AB675_2304 [Phialophora attinorum]KPI44893.1 hypothetical protein AB675_2304 [Phialophora attinorum]
MPLTEAYQRFLASPNPLNLTDDVSLHYIPTLKSFNEQGPVIRHLESQNKNVVKTKTGKTISAVEGPNAIAIETETTLEFMVGGGAYLPGIDSFIDGMIAILPMTHIVHFDAAGKIKQIRISWDQATLLRQTEVIGSRGKNWPVYDGKDQIRLIATSFSAAPPAPAQAEAARYRTMDNGFTDRPSSPTKKYIKDPHASLDLFSPNRPDDPRNDNTPPHVVAPRASARPPPREMSDIFAAGHEDFEPTPRGSPKKSVPFDAVAPKGAGAQKFGNVRVFDNDDEKETKIYRTNPARYDHFDIGDGDENDPLQHKSSQNREKTAVPMRAKTDKHGSQWDFIDFVTPAKVPLKVREQDKVNFDWNDEGGANSPSKTTKPVGRRENDAHFEMKDDGTPVSRQAVPKPRKDAQQHFAFNDEPTPAARRIIGRTDAAMGIYRDAVHDVEEQQPLGVITNQAGRNKTFGSSWEVNDDTPSPKNASQQRAKPMKKGLESHWGADAVDEPESRPVRSRGGGGSGKGFWDF